jgi:hypothetical protein
MKFNEFKNPQLTEEQIVLSYCKGEITKEDAVSHLSEMKVNLSEISLRDLGNKLSFGGIDSTDQQAAQDKAAAAAGKGLTGAAKVIAKRRAGQAALDATPNLTSAFNDYILGDKLKSKPTFSKGPGKGLSIGPNAANAATPPTKYADDPSAGDSGMNTPAPTKYADDPSAGDSGMNTPAAKAKSAKGPKVAATAANTRDYDKTVALQKKLIAQGANIKADGLMGPNTRAAMKAAGMGAKKPVAKKKLSGPERLSRLADIPAVSRALGARGELSKDDGEFADPNAMTRRKPKVAPKKKPRTLGKQNSKMPKSFGGFGPRIDDPKGGETVNLPFGGSYKTLSQKDRDSAFGDN